MRRVFKQGFWSTLLVAAISLVFWTFALAHGTWPDGPNKQWLESLQRPDNDQHSYRRSDPKSLSCCGAGDTVQTKFKVENAGGQYPEDTWYAWLKELVGQDPAGQDRSGSRAGWSALSLHAGRNGAVLRAAEGRPLTVRARGPSPRGFQCR